MSKLKRGDIFSLKQSNEKTYFGFVRSGKDTLNLVIFDDETQQLKTLSNFSATNLKATKINKKDLPALLNKAYNECFTRIKKGAKVEFVVSGQLFKGVVVKGGTQLKVEIEQDGKKLYSNGPAHQFKLIS